MLSAVPKRHLNDKGIHHSLFLCLFINEFQTSEFKINPEILTDDIDDEPSVRSTALSIFERLFLSRKFRKVTYDNLLDYWFQNDGLNDTV